MSRIRSLTLSLVALAAIHGGSASADGFYAVPGDKAVFFTSTPYRCADAPSTAPMGCMFVALYTYDSSGQPVVYTSKGSDFDSVHYNGNLREGSGTIKLTFADPINGTVQLNSDAAVSMTRHTIEAGRPGAFFNAIGTNLYAEVGQSEPETAAEVQGTTVFLARHVSGSWRVATGQVVRDADHATSFYQGTEYKVTGGSSFSASASINHYYGRNNEITVISAGDVRRKLYPLAY